MKFCEKLQKLRKDRGYSQEQLADLLEVSRQSVSKWESGTTYPEMDKLLSLCKIFNVTLDDLTNDNVTDKNIKERSKNNFSNLFYSILDIINKSFEMFKSMTSKEKGKCIIELFILFIILLIFKIPFNYINNSIIKIFINFSSKTYDILSSIWYFISNTIYLILFIAIFVYVYKIRFLDKFNRSEGIKIKDDNDNNVKFTEDNNDLMLDNKKEKHNFFLFDILAKIFNIFLKMCIILILLPIIISFIILVIITTLTLIMQFIGIHFIGIFIALLGAVLFLLVIIELLIKILLNANLINKRMFLIFLGSLITLGVGIGISTYEISKVDYKDELPTSVSADTYEYTFKMRDDLVFFDYFNTNYVINNDLKDDVNIVVNYYDDYLNVNIDLNNNFLGIYKYVSFDKTLNYIDLIKNDLKKKKLYNYNLLMNMDVKIETSEKNINIIKNNLEKYYKDKEEEYNKFEYYENRVYELEEEIYEKDVIINDLEDKINNLEEKISDISGLIE